MPDVHLIVLGQVLVAQDMALTICDHDPSALVLHAEDAEAALALIAPHARLAVAFVGVPDPDGFTGSALAGALGARGARVVMMGDRAEERGAELPWPVLHRPFTARDVASLLVRPESG